MMFRLARNFGGMMMLLCGITEIYGCEEGKYIRLKECNQQLDKEHKYHKECACHAHTIACGGTVLTKNEYEGGEGENDDVASVDIGGESYHQHDGLDEDACDFDGDKNDFYT